MTLPNSVRYIKNGAKGKWWPAAKERNQLHRGWNKVSGELLLVPDWNRIRPLCANTQDCNALKTLIERASSHVWITFESGYLWWCLVHDAVTPNGPSSESEGHFFLNCASERPWSNQSLLGKTLTITDLPGTATTTAGFKATVCKPRGADQILRIIKGEQNPLVVAARGTRDAYEGAVLKLVRELSPQDFELLISLILDRTGWTRLTRVGGVTEGIDLDVENWASEERAFVQVKGAASQETLEEYISRFNDRDHYARMIFAVHSPTSELRAPQKNVHVWTGARLSKLIVRLGLGEWIETKLA